MSERASVTASVEVAVDPTTAFEVFTADIGAWYKRGPYSFKDPTRALGVRFEPGVGGRLLEVHDAATGEGIEWGRVLVWEPGARLVFSDLLSSAPPAPVTEPSDERSRRAYEGQLWVKHTTTGRNGPNTRKMR